LIAPPTACARTWTRIPVIAYRAESAFEVVIVAPSGSSQCTSVSLPAPLSVFWFAPGLSPWLPTAVPMDWRESRSTTTARAVFDSGTSRLDNFVPGNRVSCDSLRLVRIVENCQDLVLQVL